MLHLLIPLTISFFNLIGPPLHQSDEQEALKKFENKIAQAVVHHNLDTLKTVYAFDFVFTHGTGQVQNKDEWLAAVKKSDYTVRELEAQAVEIHGDIAITTGRLTINPRDKETFWVDYVRVYRRHNHRWQMISHRSVDASYKHQ